ncbi:MAG TPA: hypothetical protein VJ939_07655 [Bacteroidales bacterium]|nr:hypothetical protein [Bacteroidales bacterium]
MTKEKFNALLKKLKRKKKFKSELHRGKVKWKEDALEYQRNSRNEW